MLDMFKQVNQNVQKNYNIGKPNFLKVPKTQNFEGKKAYHERLNKLKRNGLRITIIKVSSKLLGRIHI